MTFSEASLRGQIGAHTRWARETDRSAATLPARRGLEAKFEREVDPEGILPPAERAKRVENARNAHMAKMRLASSKSRAAAANARRSKTSSSPVGKEDSAVAPPTAEVLDSASPTCADAQSPLGRASGAGAAEGLVREEAS